MRHLRKSRRFGRSPAHRQAMFRNLVTSLFLHERILTTLERAKELRRVAEKLVTLGKRGGLAARRLSASRLVVQGRREGKHKVFEEAALKKLFETLAPRYQNRPGGYTRIIRTGRRYGDNASMAFIEMIPEERQVKADEKKEVKKPARRTTKTGAKKAAATKAPPKKAAAPAAQAKKTAKTKTGSGASSKSKAKASTDK